MQPSHAQPIYPNQSLSPVKPRKARPWPFLVVSRDSPRPPEGELMAAARRIVAISRAHFIDSVQC